MLIFVFAVVLCTGLIFQTSEVSARVSLSQLQADIEALQDDVIDLQDQIIIERGRINGLVSQSCPTGETVTGIDATGALICAPLVQPVGSRIVFITREIYNGNLGGVAGADAKCQAAADSAGLSGSYLAWISDGVRDPAGRFTHGTEPYVLTNGDQVAYDWDDMTDGSIDTNIHIDQHGMNAVTGYSGIVWANVNRNGTKYTSPSGDRYDCDGWTSDGYEKGHVGSLDNPTAIIHSNVAFCRDMLPLYCFEQ